MLHESLADILGKNPGLPYDVWLINASRRFITDELEMSVAKWLDIIGLADQYTGRINTTREDIYEFVLELERCSEVILALNSLAKTQMEDKSEDVSEG